MMKTRSLFVLLAALLLALVLSPARTVFAEYFYPAPWDVYPTSVSNGVVGHNYNPTTFYMQPDWMTPWATPGPTTTWSIDGGSLPPGLTLGTSTGVLSGVPTTPGEYAFSVRVESGKSGQYTLWGDTGTTDWGTPIRLRILAEDPAQTGPTYSVTSTDGMTDHHCGQVYCNLREAIEAANNDGVDSTIELVTGTAHVISEVDNNPQDVGPNGLPQITSAITINAHGRLITRDPALPYARFFYVDPFGSLTLDEIQLEDGRLDPNSDESRGGAILNEGRLIVTNSYLAGNAARIGGAIDNRGTVTSGIYNSTFYKNSAQYGAILSFGSLDLYNNTFFDNIAAAGQESAVSLGWYSITKYNFYNNLFASSDPTTVLCDTVPSTIIKAAGNIATDSSCTGSTVTTYSALQAAPAPDKNGGMTKNFAIQAGSSAIDKGNTTACQNTYINGRDQRARPRFVDGNGDAVAQCDVGAYEYSLPQSTPPGEPESGAPTVAILLAPSLSDGSHGWYRSPVTVRPQADDASPVIELRCALDPQAVPMAYDDLPEDLCPFLTGAPVSADGPHSFYAAAMDLWGNKSEVVLSRFQIDTTPPVITCPAAGPFLLHSGDQMVGPAAVDASVSGLDEATSTLSGIVATESVGPAPLTFIAFDLAGNSASQDCAYNVIYDFGGFYPPVTAAPALNGAKAGSAIPLKFSLAGDQGLDVIAAGYPASQAVVCDTLAPAGEPESTGQPGTSALSFEAGNDQYNYVWKTDKAWAGACRGLVIQLVDGTEHLAYFQFK